MRRTSLDEVVKRRDASRAGCAIKRPAFAGRKGRVRIPDSDFLSAVRAIRKPTSFSAELAALAQRARSFPFRGRKSRRVADHFSSRVVAATPGGRRLNDRQSRRTVPDSRASESLNKRISMLDGITRIATTCTRLLTRALAFGQIPEKPERET